MCSDVVRQLRLSTTSEALREGIRLLVREAREIAAAEDCQAPGAEQTSSASTPASWHPYRRA